MPVFTAFSFPVTISPRWIPIALLLNWFTMHPPEHPGNELQVCAKNKSWFFFITPFENPICLSFLLIAKINTFWFK